METKHTPVAVYYLGRDEDIYIIGPAPQYKFLCRLLDDSTCPDETWTERLQRAELFAEAINQHAVLTARVAELEAALERIAAWDFDFRGDCVANAQALARAALAGKEGQP